MSGKTIYFDNAAGSHPKPENVYLEIDKVLRQGGNPGRSAHSLAMAASKTVFECRLKLAEFLEIEQAERLIFTPGCTQSINMALQGMKLKKDDLVLVSALEHNAVMRTVHHLQESIGIRAETVPYEPGIIFSADCLQEILSAKKVRLCAFSEASNVTGEMLDLEAVSSICKQYEVPLLIDAAQTAGVFQKKPGNLNVQYWCAPAHKGLLGPSGLGLLFLGQGADLNPLIYGGTGSKSEDMQMPSAYPDRLEAGSFSSANIAGLKAALEFLQGQDCSVLASKELALSDRLRDFLESKDEFLLPPRPKGKRTPLVSFRIKNMDPSLTAELLDRQFGICTRAGLHCAAQAHKTLGTLDTGLVRVSFSCFNTQDELDQLIVALSKIIKNPTG